MSRIIAAIAASTAAIAVAAFVAHRAKKATNNAVSVTQAPKVSEYEINNSTQFWVRVVDITIRRIIESIEARSAVQGPYAARLIDIGDLAKNTLPDGGRLLISTVEYEDRETITVTLDDKHGNTMDEVVITCTKA